VPGKGRKFFPKRLGALVFFTRRWACVRAGP